MASLKLLSLLLVANGVPVIIHFFLGQRCSFPLDAGTRFIDGRPLLGASKTVCGVVGSVIATGLLAPLLDIPMTVGLMIGAFAMLGDGLSSFTKRRMGIPPSGSVPVLDQVPESLLPALAAGPELQLDVAASILVVAAFAAINLGMSRLLGTASFGRP